MVNSFTIIINNLSCEIDKDDFVMSINKNELTKEMVAKALQCKDADELLTLAKAEGMELTKEDADAYLTELSDFELDSDALTQVVGGGCYTECNSERYHCHSK